MHLFAYVLLLLTLLGSLAAAGMALIGLWSGRPGRIGLYERAHLGLTGLLSLCALLLFLALASHDFSLKYVADYTDMFMPMFYVLTAFWAGQAGSLLFWAWMVALIGALALLLPGYKALTDETKAWFWLFHFAIMAVFALLLSSWSNPFVRLSPPPLDGNGLNPLLQHPGMIFHPPLLFLGYAGFTVPACLALAQHLSSGSGQERSWLTIGRPIFLTGWLFLTAGIILGAWWSYMELGWGGYWAWDPVENASLIPWLVASAFLHTAVVQSRRGALVSVNVFLMALSLITAFFATYLVRSGVVDSLHAFGDGGVGGPLLIFILSFTAIAALTAVLGKNGEPRPLGELLSREGMLVVACWILLALGAVVLLGTMWPVLSAPFSQAPMGLDAGFYNRACLPFFAALAVLLAVCPWLSWKQGVKDAKKLGITLGLALVTAGLVYAQGYTQPVALVAIAGSVGALTTIFMVLVLDKAARASASGWGAYLTHLGLALAILGVAFSGPYKQETEARLKPGETMQVGAYEVTYVSMDEGADEAMAYIEATLTVSRDGKEVGTMKPQRRRYRKFQQTYAEASVIPGLGDELYATLLSASETSASFTVSVNPLINWIWIGGTLMCLAPFLSAFGGRRSNKA